MKKIIPIPLVALLILAGPDLIAHVYAVATKSIDWKYDLNKAAEAASKAKKPLLVDFYTDWCHWCKRLDQDTYTNNDVIKLSKRFVCVKVDGDKYPGLMEKHRINSYPVTLFLNSKSKEVKRVVGYREPKEFLQEMQGALKKAK